MVSIRTPLLDIQEIIKIFEKYLSTLTSQFGPKKLLTSLANRVYALLDPDNNEYIQNEQEHVKRAMIEAFINKITKALEKENPVPKLIEILSELNAQFERAKRTQYYNFSKYRIALRAVISFIVKHIQHDEAFQNYIIKLKNELTTVNAKLDKASISGFDGNTDPDSIKKRNQLILQLANLGDVSAIKAATNQYNLFDAKLEKPSDTFRPIVRYDEELSTPAEIIYDIPWVMQPLLYKFFYYRIENHCFPDSKSVWESYQRKSLEDQKSHFSPKKESKETKEKTKPIPSKKETINKEIKPLAALSPPEKTSLETSPPSTSIPSSSNNKDSKEEKTISESISIEAKETKEEVKPVDKVEKTPHSEADSQLNNIQPASSSAGIVSRLPISITSDPISGPVEHIKEHPKTDSIESKTSLFFSTTKPALGKKTKGKGKHTYSSPSLDELKSPRSTAS